MKSTKIKILNIVVVVLLLTFLTTAGLLLLEVWDKRQGAFPTLKVDEDIITYKGDEYVLKESVETFLVLGLDKFEGESVADSYNNDKQSDFLMLFVFDNETKKCAAININRDTMTTVNVLGVAGNKVDTVTKQIALAHTYGNGKDVSCRNVADAVSNVLLGMRVNHYVSLTLDSVAVLNDLVGGVEVTVLDEFTGIDDTLVKGENVTLKGEQALRYIRTRYGLDDSSNSARMARQKQYLEALHKQTLDFIKNDEAFVVEASLKMSDYMVSDRSVTQMQDLMRKFSEYEFTEICYIDGENVVGEKYMEFYPDEDSVKDIVVDLFYEPKK